MYRSSLFGIIRNAKVYNRINLRLKSELRVTNEALNDELNYFATKKPTSVPLSTLILTGKGSLVSEGSETQARERTLMQIASFLHRELPIRLAYLVKDIDSIPHIRDEKDAQKVRNMYAKTFQDIVNCPIPNTRENEKIFSELIGEVYYRYANILLLMARSAYAIRGKFDKIEFEQQEEIHKFLDSFYMSRIGLRMLIGQYITIRDESHDEPFFVGMINEKTSPAEVTRHAIEDAKFMCEREYGDAPEVSIHGHSGLTFKYVPAHLHYILLELLKNSMRATMEFHGESDSLPPIKVVIADGLSNEDVVIKVSDEGGGISRSNMPRIWSYLFTTADPGVQQAMVGGEEDGAHDFGTASPLAGLGYGLPIARTYARYFGGDLNIMSMEGYGTDAFVHCSRIGSHDEPVPGCSPNISEY